MKLSIITLTLSLGFGVVSANSPHSVTDAAGRIIISSSGQLQTYKTAALEQGGMRNQVYSVAQFPQQAEWIWQDLGNSIGQNIMVADDVDMDGDTELLLSTNGQGFGDARSVLLLSSDLTAVECSFDLGTTPLDYHISQMDQDSALEVTIVSANGFKTFDGATCQIQIEHEFSNQVDAAGLGDLNNDNIPDVVYAQNGHLYSAPINDMQNVSQRLGFGGTKIIVESLGRAGGDDIGVYTQTHTVLRGDDLSTLTEIFNWNSRYFAFGDVDGDGSFEVVGIKNGSPRILNAVNVSSGTVVADFEVEWPDVLVTQDVNQDGKDDILLGNNQWGDVIVHDYTGQELFRVNNPEHGVSNLTVTDIDKDGQLEMLFGAGHSSSGSDHLFKADWQNQTITWQSEDFDGPFMLSKGLIEINQQQQIAVSISETNSGYDEGGSIFLNTINGNRSDLFQPVQTSWGYVNSIEVGKPIASGNPFVCHTGDYTYDEFIACYDAITGEEKWLRDYLNGNINFIKMMDVDNDQSEDLLVVSTSGVISAYQAANGFLKWQTEDIIDASIYKGFKDVFIVNNELWVLAAGDLYKFNPSTGATIETVMNSGLSAIDFANGQLYGARDGEGFGVINPVDYSILNLLYPETLTIAYLNVSEDGLVALVSTGLSQNYPYNQGTPDMDVTLVSINNDFSPWYVGEINAYDTNFPDQFNLYLSNFSSVRKFNLTILNENIFADGFE